MSLTTLGQQLAALNATGGPAGFSQASSRRHKDAVGRGVNFSARLGHVVTSRSHLFKPSIIYTSSKKAADVPLATIRENCVAALQELTESDRRFESFQATLCKSTMPERGMMTPKENDAVDVLIKELTLLLGTHLSAKQYVPSCLHVFEYLLRKFDIHLRPRLASFTILTLLPYHEEPYMRRFLQLVDLAATDKWIFLRPYTGPNSSFARQVVSKQVAKNTALLQDICVLAAKASQISRHDRILSFAAAVIVEAVTLQTNRSGSIEEQTCKILLSHAGAACKNRKVALYQNWGQVLASCVVENSVLARDPQQALASNVIYGVLKANHRTRLNGLMLAISILSDGPDSERFESRLPMIGLAPIGVAMDEPVFDTLTQMSRLPADLGCLQSDERISSTGQMVASVVVLAWDCIIAESNNSDTGRDKSERMRSLIVDTVNEPKLASFWTAKKGKAVASFVYYIISSCIKQANDERYADATGAVFEALRKRDMAGYDVGVAYALTVSARSQRSTIASLAGLATAESPSNEDRLIDLLPPRIALDHADSDMRVTAVKRLMADEQRNMNNEDTGGETLLDALLRRFSVEDDLKVAEVVGTAAKDLIDAGASYTTSNSAAAIQSFYRWTELLSNNSETVKQLALQLVLSTIQHAKDGVDGITFDQTVILAASMRSQAQNRDEIITALCRLSSPKFNRKSRRSKTTVATPHVLTSESLIRMAVSKKQLPRGAVHQSVYSAFLQSILDEFATSLAAKRGKVDPKQASLAIELSLHVLRRLLSDEHSVNRPFGEGTLEQSLQRCLSLTSVHTAYFGHALIEQVYAFASTPSNVFDSMVAPILTNICRNVKDKNKQSVSMYAVLAEALVSSDKGPIVDNLLSLIASSIAGTPEPGAHFIAVPTLALIFHPEEAVRAKVISIFPKLGPVISNKSSLAGTDALEKFLSYLHGEKETILLGDVEGINSVIRSALCKADSGGALQKLIGGLCVYACAACGSIASFKPQTCFDHTWLDTVPNGGILAAATVLRMMEMAGEQLFPLSARWMNAGSFILQGLRRPGSVLAASADNASQAETFHELVNALTRILGGFIVCSDVGTSSPSKTIISTGPSNGGRRKRSYSMDRGSVESFVYPPPEGVLDALCAVLRAESPSPMESLLRTSLCDNILRNHSWGEKVFTKLSSQIRRNVVEALIQNADSGVPTECEAALLELPLDVDDLKVLLSAGAEDDAGHAKASLLADYVYMHSSKLASSTMASDILSALFEKLVLLAHVDKANKETDGAQGSDFACQSIISALGGLCEGIKSKLHASSSISLDRHKDFSTWMETVVGLLGESSQTIRTLTLARPRLVLMKVISTMYILHPLTVGKYIRRALMANIATEVSKGVVAPAQFSILIPRVFDMLETDKSGLMDTFRSLVAFTEELTDGNLKGSLYEGLVGSLPTAVSSSGISPAGALVLTLLATGDRPTTALFSTGAKVSIVELATSLIQLLPAKAQVESAAWIVETVRKLIIGVADDGMDEDEPFPYSVGSIRSLVSNNLVGADTELFSNNGKAASRSRATNSSQGVLDLCRLAIVTVSETLVSDTFATFVAGTVGNESSAPLQLWQNLLLLQTTEASNIDGADVSLVNDALSDTARSSLETLQAYLPLPVFLASTTSLITDGDTDDIKSRALRLLASRANDVSPEGAEVALFVDLLAILTELTKVDAAAATVQKSALSAIESIARAFCPPEDNGSILQKDAVPKDALASGLDTTSKLLLHLSEKLSNAAQSPRPSTVQQLYGAIRAANSCCATLVRACGARTLPYLATMVDAFVRNMRNCHQLLLSSNQQLASEIKSHVRSLQISTLQALGNLIQTIPQFMSTYIQVLLSNTALCSKTLLAVEEDNSDSTVYQAAVTTRNIFATRIPSRQLIPSIAEVMGSCDDDSAMAAVLSILADAVNEASGPQLAALSPSIVASCLHVFEHTPTAANAISSTANQVLLSMILKLSEIQLRPIFGRLREWRGDLNKHDPNEFADRRVAFWDLCSLLGTALKSIFLPCLTTVFADAVDELTYAATQLCSAPEQKVSGGKKKRKMSRGKAPHAMSNAFILSLKPLLHSLQVSLEADAREGGEWVRADDSQRYNMLLDPLCRMLQSDFSAWAQADLLGSAAETYKSVIEGDESGSGSVISTIVALASAAGDEQLWKPLNHAVVQAAGDEERSDVRRAGVTCLMELIRTLGEEYMVLLPECLPVLSELLEDDDERIAAIARDCISLSEELLGETLEDSLR